MLKRNHQDFDCWMEMNNSLFNFPQTIWLSSEINMEWMGRTPDSLSAQTLSINILSLVLTGTSIQLYKGSCSHLALELYEAFTEEVVNTMPYEGGSIPFEVVAEWVMRNIAPSLLLQAG